MNRSNYVSARVRLDVHQFLDVAFLKNCPVLVKVLEFALQAAAPTMQIVRRNRAEILAHGCSTRDYPVVKLAYFCFQLGKGIEEHVSLLDHHLAKFVLLSVDPQKWKCLLGAVKDLHQVIKRVGLWVLVEDAVGHAKVLPVVTISTL